MRAASSSSSLLALSDLARGGGEDVSLRDLGVGRRGRKPPRPRLLLDESEEPLPPEVVAMARLKLLRNPFEFENRESMADDLIL